MRFAPVLIAAAGFWLIAAAAGSWCLFKYESAPGSVARTPSQWPVATRIEASHDRPTLVMFAHPQCPCTRASIENLNRLLARGRDRVSASVLFFQPSNRPPAWAHSSLWNSAAAIPGVRIQGDSDGAEARRFGAETSGFVVLYDTKGSLLFRGGITAGRGHAGDSPGAEAILSAIGGDTASTPETPVFGCTLLDKCIAVAN